MSNNYDFTISINVPPVIDYFEEARDEYFRVRFLDYPKEVFESFAISITIGSTAKNGYLVYAIIDALPHYAYSTFKNVVSIYLTSEDAFAEHYETILDLLSVVKTWKSTSISYNEIEIDFLGFRYLGSHILGRKNAKDYFNIKNIKAIRQKYVVKKRIAKERKKDIPIAKIGIRSSDRERILFLVLKRYVELYCKGISFEKHQISTYETVLMMENTYIVDFRLEPRYWERYDDPNCVDWESPYIIIQELTPNTLFKYYHSKFERSFLFDYVGMQFLKFHGIAYYDPKVDHTAIVDKALPHIKLRNRCNAYEGETYHFVYLRMETPSDTPVYGIGYTQGAIHSFVLKLCKELEDKNSLSLIANGASCLPFSENKEFVDAFLSWKGKKKRWRLENKFAYYYEDRQVKNDADLYKLPKELLDDAARHPYNGEWGYYAKPLNRWKSEELVYNITKRLYKDYQVIYQYRPYYLSTEGGTMSYDIYICGLKVAIEYQGQQHFEPVDYFGGAENHERQKQRDALKAERSKENGVHLVYVYYWESITPELIKNKVEQSLQDD